MNTKTLPPLGADTWIHTQLMRDLDRSTNELSAACDTGPVHAPTPTYQALSRISDLRIRPVRFGSEQVGPSALAKIRAFLGSLRAVPSLATLAVQVRREGIDIIHTSDRPRDALACVVLGRLTNTKSLIHVHVAYGDWMSPPLRWSLKRADVLVAVSEFVRGTLVTSGHDPTRIHVVLNAIDPERWRQGEGREQVRQEFDVPENAPLVLSVCRLFPGKGPEELIRCMPAVRRVHPDARLLIVGGEMEPGYREHLAWVAQDLAMERHVRFDGYRGDVPRLMAAADVFAMPSLYEPFGLVYLEAMAMGLPVVALDSGGTPEVVVDGLTGLLSRPGDSTQLTCNLLALLGDPERRRKMGEAGRRRVEEYFTTPRMAADAAVVYKRVSSQGIIEPDAVQVVS